MLQRVRSRSTKPQLVHKQGSIMSDRLRRGYVGSNGTASVVELITGVITGDIARIVDGTHGTFEIGVGNTMMKDAQQVDQVEFAKNRRIYAALCSISLAGAAGAGAELLFGTSIGSVSPVFDAIGTLAAGTSMVSAMIGNHHLLPRIREKYGRLMHGRRLNPDIVNAERGVIMHITFLDTPSSTLAFTSGALRMVGHAFSAKNGFAEGLETAESLAGIAVGVIGASFFMPTQNNVMRGVPELAAISEEA